MTREELEEVAQHHKVSTSTLLDIWATPLFIRAVEIAVQAKERPRTGRNGHVYTPKKTQDCERAIGDAFFDAPLLFHPIRLEINIYETAPKVKASGARWLRPVKSDLDNKVKTITDALNGVLYRDDRQISTIHASARYVTKEPYFTVHVYRDGLSENEWEDVHKVLPHV